MSDVAASKSLGTLVLYIRANAQQYDKTVDATVSGTQRAMATVTKEVQKATAAIDSAVTKSADSVKTQTDKALADLRTRTAAVANLTKTNGEALVAAQRSATAGLGQDYTAYLNAVAEKAQASTQVATKAAKESATAVTSATKQAAGKNLTVWQDMVRRFKIASQPAQADWKEMMAQMTGSTGRFATGARGLIRSVFTGIGIGAGFAAISNAIEAVINKVGEASRMTEQLTKSNRELDTSYRELHKTTRDLAIAQKDLPTQVVERKSELDKASKSVKDIGEEIRQITEDRQRAAEIIGKANIPYMDPMGRFAGEQIKRIKEAAALREKYGLGTNDAPETIFVKMTEKQNEALERQKAAYKAINAEREKLVSTETALADAIGGDTPGGASDAVKAQKRVDEITKGIQDYKKVLDQRIKLEQDARTKTGESAAAMSELAEKYRLGSDESAKYKKQVEEIWMLYERFKQGKSGLNATEAALAIDAVQRERDRTMGKQPNKDKFDLQNIDRINEDAKQGRVLPGMEEFNRIDEEQKANEKIYQNNLQYYESNLAAKQAYNERMAQLDKARNMLTLSLAEQVAGQLVDITETGFGKQSGAYKAMFVTQKAFAIAQATINMHAAMSSALATQPFFPLGMVMALQAASQGASIISNIQSVASSFEGGGSTGNGPRSGGMDGKGGFMAMLHPQERVIDEYQNGEMMEKNSATTNVVVNQTFTGGVTQADLARQSELTKRQTMEAVADAVSRGGSYRKAIQR